MVNRMNQPLGGKYVGAGGALLTPAQVAQQKQIAASLMEEAGDTSPVGHWTGGLNRVVQGLLGGRDMYRAREGERIGREGALAKLAGRGGQNSVAQALAAGQAATAADNAVASDMGGFLDSLIKSESGGNWSALNKEGYGGRLQFGADRLADAARAGVVPAGIDGAAFSAMSPEQQMAVEQWHFNDIENQARRMGLDQYIGQVVGGVPVTMEAIKGMAHLGGIGGTARFLKSGGQYNPADSNGTSLRDYGLRHGGTAPSGSGSYAGPGAGNVSEIAALLADPWVAEVAGPQLQAEMQQQMQMQNAAYQQQLQQQDPMRQLEMQRAQLELDQLRNPGRPKPLEINGQLVDPDTLEVLGDYRTINPEDSQRYRPVGGQIWDFSPEGGGAPVLVGGGQEEIIYGADGQPIVVRGPSGSGKSLTEGQSKDVVYSTRAEGALRGLEALDSSILTSRTDAALDALPMGLGREMQSEQFQQAQNLGNEFLQAILRKDTGAAITKDEQQLYGDTYLPRPGDTPGVLETKKIARARAIEAMKAGMDMRQVTMTEQALIRSANRSQPVAQPDQAGPVPATEQQQGPARISDKASYDALPSGATFIAPDGTTRRKP